jgi:para-nitrobenzyl esterase
MIIGTCLEDGGVTITDTSDDEASLRKCVENQLRALKAEDKADEVLALYRNRYPHENGFLLRAILATDLGIRRSDVTQAERKAAQGAAPVYMYRWDWRRIAKARIGARYMEPISVRHLRIPRLR